MRGGMGAGGWASVCIYVEIVVFCGLRLYLELREMDCVVGPVSMDGYTCDVLVYTYKFVGSLAARV